MNRFKRNRRPLAAQQQARPQLVVASLIELGGTPAVPRLFLQLSDPMFGSGGIPEIQLATPDFASPANPVFTATGFSFQDDGYVLVVEFADVPADVNSAIRISPYPANVRTTAGGYLAPGFFFEVATPA